jgi:hypothetical protein
MVNVTRQLNTYTLIGITLCWLIIRDQQMEATFIALS